MTARRVDVSPLFSRPIRWRPGAYDLAGGAMDCWGVVRWVLERGLGRALPAEAMPWDARTETSADYWRRVLVEQDGWWAGLDDGPPWRCGDVILSREGEGVHVSVIYDEEGPWAVTMRRQGSVQRVPPEAIAGRLGCYRLRSSTRPSPSSCPTTRGSPGP